MEGFFELRTDKLMDKSELAALCKALRNMKNLTQGDVADRIAETRGEAVSKQSVSLAENPEYAGMETLRLEIIEMLSGRSLSGPYWKFDEEVKSGE